MRRLRFWMIPTLLVIFALGIVGWVSTRPDRTCVPVPQVTTNDRSGMIANYSIKLCPSSSGLTLPCIPANLINQNGKAGKITIINKACPSPAGGIKP